MELDGPPRMVGWTTWSGRERSSQTQFLPVPGVRLVHPPLFFFLLNWAIQKIFRILKIPQIIQIMSMTRAVLASSEILNSCNCLWEHSIETRKLNPPVDWRTQRSALLNSQVGIRVDLSVWINGGDAIQNDLFSQWALLAAPSSQRHLMIAHRYLPSCTLEKNGLIQ